MLEMLRDPIWQFMGALVGVVAIAFTFYLYTKRPRKSFSYQILSCESLTSVSEEIKGRIQVLFEGQPVQNVYLLVIRFMNSGSEPILSTDFARPACLVFDEKAQILSAEVVETEPTSLQATVNTNGTQVVLTPTLLNQEDSVKVKVLAADAQKFKVDGRIVGVKEIQRIPPYVRLSVARMLIFATLLVLATFELVGALWVLQETVSKIIIVTMFVMTVSLFLMLYWFYRGWLYRVSPLVVAVGVRDENHKPTIDQEWLNL